MMNRLMEQFPTVEEVPSYDDMAKMRTESYNKTPGKLTGYDCPECLNKGYIAKYIDGREVMAECRCLKIRNTLTRISRSGLEQQLRECTFKSFETQYEWQRIIKDAAVAFVESNAPCFFISGQTGCGKTHICTAMIGNLIKQGYETRYFVWREDSTELKALVNDESYAEKIGRFKRCDVLYIDDLFKQKKITDADIRLAFELIDYRVRNKLRTLISTELSDEEITDLDEALGGRIQAFSRGYSFYIPKDRSKNYRLRK